MQATRRHFRRFEPSITPGHRRSGRLTVTPGEIGIHMPDHAALGIGRKLGKRLIVFYQHAPERLDMKVALEFLERWRHADPGFMIRQKNLVVCPIEGEREERVPHHANPLPPDGLQR